jgi:hypothetical protein
MGHLHSLWHAALEQQEDGDLSSWSDEFIAQMADYPGDAPQFVRLLQKHNWLEGKVLHDWLDYAGKYLTAKYRTANPKKLRQILSKHKSGCSPTKVRKKSGQDAIRLGRSGIKEKPEEEGIEGERKPPPLSPDRLIELYNTSTPDECPAVTVVSPARKEKAKKYISIFPEEEFWREVFQQIHHSKFLRGLANHNGHHGFIADFDWLLTRGRDGSENVAKVHDGRYRDGK